MLNPSRRFLALAFLSLPLLGARAETRQILSLDGEWQIAQGPLGAPPALFDRKIVVPGLVDMAQPAFDDVGVKSARRAAFWYEKKFPLAGPVPAVATLKIGKAFFGARVYLNGAEIGEHLPLFTPGYFDLQKNLKGNGAENELLIRVGANPDAIPATLPRGGDSEKHRYIPGIFDSVQLFLSGTPNIVRVQAVPDILAGQVHVQALLHNAGPDASTPLTLTVRETKSGEVVGTTDLPPLAVPSQQDTTVDADVVISHPRLWSPETPFLYTLQVRTDADQLTTRFGLREFHFDPASGHAFLNGRPYFLRGTNVSLYRFFEDPDRGNLPWDRTWVANFFHSFQLFHWNSFRYSIGFPPAFWYDIDDEQGLLVQDEFPIWGLAPEVTTAELVREYTEFMQEDWNHPSVVFWDAQNETLNDPRTGAALSQVRHLDLSHRAWENGWGGSQEATDVVESHPYHFGARATMPMLATMDKIPPYVPPNRFRSPLLINEYGGLWLQRNGLPTKATHTFYKVVNHLTHKPALIE